LKDTDAREPPAHQSFSTGLIIRQNEPRNRCILDILDRLASLEGLRWDANMEQVARQAMRIRSNFFDNTRVLEDCIPQVLLVPGDYRKDEFPPRFVFAD